MPQPQPIWERWKKDPEKAEKFYTAIWIGMILLNVLIMLGVVAFMFFWWRSR